MFERENFKIHGTLVQWVQWFGGEIQIRFLVWSYKPNYLIGSTLNWGEKEINSKQFHPIDFFANSTHSRLPLGRDIMYRCERGVMQLASQCWHHKGSRRSHYQGKRGYSWSKHHSIISSTWLQSLYDEGSFGSYLSTTAHQLSKEKRENHCLPRLCNKCPKCDATEMDFPLCQCTCMITMNAHETP